MSVFAVHKKKYRGWKGMQVLQLECVCGCSISHPFEFGAFCGQTKPIHHVWISKLTPIKNYKQHGTKQPLRTSGPTLVFSFQFLWLLTWVLVECLCLTPSLTFFTFNYIFNFILLHLIYEHEYRSTDIWCIFYFDVGSSSIPLHITLFKEKKISYFRNY